MKKKSNPPIGFAKKSITISNEDKISKVCFAHLDRNQGQSFKDWADAGLLVKLNERLADISKNNLQELIKDSKRAHLYNDFPPSKSTEYTFPKHIQDDVRWCAFHVNGEAVLAGHIVDDTFYVVFLDLYHKFWISKLKHT
jgi:hypothetical protein